MSDIFESIGLSLKKIGEALGIANMDPEAGLIFITGGNGPIGHRVAMRLLRAGYPQVRLGAHHPTTMEDMNKEGAEIADFNWNRPDTFEKALAGVKSVLCTAPYIQNWKENFVPFLNACKKAGVKHFVKIYFYHARVSGDPFQNVPLVRDHGDCDEALVRSGLSYTIISASHLMSNPLIFQGRELRKDEKPAVLYGASANRGINYVSPNDVAEVAVRVLMEPPAHTSKEYTLTGEKPITEQEVCQVLSDHLKKPIMYVDQPHHTFKDGEKLSGDPEWMVEDLTTLEMVKASGYEADPGFATKDIEKICGHPPETFNEYILATEYMVKDEM